MDEDINNNHNDVYPTSFGDAYAMLRQSGWPSFEEWKKNPEKYRQAKENMFAQVDQGSSLLKNLKRQKYYFKTIAGNKYECQSLNKVAEIAEQEGLQLSELSCHPELVEDSSATITCQVTFCAPGVRP